MSTFTRINGAVMQLDAAVPAIQKANQAIDAAAHSLALIDSERESLVESAMTANQAEAGKLVKAAEGLRVKRLSALLAAARIPALKAAAQVAIRQAAAEDVEVHRQALAVHESQLAEAARLAGYREGDRQWITLMNGDPTRATVKRFMTESKATAHNFTTATPDDDLALADIQRRIREMLA